ncbi:sigma-70 family RNA polymerase sigma factor [Leeia aquatica]|uniref:Sigma-70 family RNA polymerase sigma factor n=1 Tax=Leeia aquatica TaxID=2725557 RepID=A0A847SEW0_9NEIS|nr:sigma-70 family RNA polymerase sigma factor [Leeia aquatica]NLR74482.1 sigma-70 family RNA polymerase sigma factor [Leeia aquatica]
MQLSGDGLMMADAFLAQRAHLRRVAYRMLGDPHAVEDVLQEAWLRWQAQASLPDVPAAWLHTVVSRLCLDQLRLRRQAQHHYAGSWLPAPWQDEADEQADPLAQLGQRAELGQALMLLLERLSPDERVAWVMYDSFDHDHRQIATVLGRSEAACRQLVSRARKRLQQGERRFACPPEQRQQVLLQFLTALGSGDLSGLLATLAPAVQLHSDGGGKVLAASRPVHGPRAVSRLLLGVRRVQPAGSSIQLACRGGETVLLGLVDGALHFQMSFAVGARGIQGLYLQLNPDKLAQPVAVHT